MVDWSARKGLHALPACSCRMAGPANTRLKCQRAPVRPSSGTRQTRLWGIIPMPGTDGGHCRTRGVADQGYSEACMVFQGNYFLTIIWRGLKSEGSLPKRGWGDDSCKRAHLDTASGPSPHRMGRGRRPGGSATQGRPGGSAFAPSFARPLEGRRDAMADRRNPCRGCPNGGPQSGRENTEPGGSARMRPDDTCKQP
jgi:hypothetical protein